MRVFIVLAIVYLACAASAQQYSGSSPFYSSPMANAGRADSGTEATTRPNIIQRVFGWLRRPTTESPAGEPIAQSSNIVDDQLPKESTDRMINDAISDRILEESRVQQTVVGSPFIHEQETSSSHPKFLVAIPQSDRSGYGKSVQNPPNQPTEPNASIEKLPLTEVLRIVNSSNLVDCVARVVCELSCNANAYGNPGRIVFRNLIKLQFDQTIRSDDAKVFRQAASKGRQLVQGKRECKECFTIYPVCHSNSEDLVAVSSMFKL